MNATASIILETRKPKVDGTYPVVLRVTHNRKRKYYTLKGSSLTTDQFRKLLDKKIRGKNDEATRLRGIGKDMADSEQKACEIVARLGDGFSFGLFEDEYFKETGRNRNKASVQDAYNSFIEGLVNDRHISTSSNFDCAKRSINEYVKKKRKSLAALTFQDITPNWLKGYEQHMVDTGRSFTTVSMYLRTLRQLYLAAIKDGIVSQASYPFGKDEKGKTYQIPEAFNYKRALDKDDIKRLIHYRAVKASGEEYARDMWTFSYLCNGANLKDIARLRFRNVDFHNNELTFIRAKTVHNRKKKDILVTIHPMAMKIIERYANKDRASDNYVFPILVPDLTPLQEYNRVHDERKYINRHLRTIATALKLNPAIELTTMTARHSYATMLRNAGVPVAFISEGMGHSNIATTENYLKSFPEEKRREYSGALVDF